MRWWVKCSVFAFVLVAGCEVDRSPLWNNDHDASSAGSGSVSGSGGFGGVGAVGGVGGIGSTGGVGGIGATGGVGGGIVDAAIDAPIQGYEPGAVGAPCTADTDCMAGGLQRTCFTENYFSGLLTLPGGYCSNLCDLAMPQPCEPGASCITIPIGFAPVVMCMRTCTAASDCRQQDGYSCNLPFTSTSSVCSL